MKRIDKVLTILMVCIGVFYLFFLINRSSKPHPPAPKMFPLTNYSSAGDGDSVLFMTIEDTSFGAAVKYGHGDERICCIVNGFIHDSTLIDRYTGDSGRLMGDSIKITILKRIFIAYKEDN